MERYYLGIDVGTGSTKAIAVSFTGNVLHSVGVSYPAMEPAPYYHEQAPELIWQAFIKCISRTTRAIGASPELVVLSSAMHSLIPLDGAGNAVMNMMTWADGRSADVAGELRASEYAEVIYARTGTPVHAMSPLCKIAWLRKNKPDVFAASVMYISIKEYIWYRLFGVYEVDYSIASATGLFDINDLAWYAPSLAFAGILASQLSTPVNTDHQRSGMDANLAAQLNIDAGTPFMIGASDGCLAHLGSHAFKPGGASLTIGSSGAVRVSRTKPAINFSSMTFNYRLDEKTFVSGGPINNGGLVLRWFLGDILGDAPPDNDTFLAKVNATTVIAPGAEGLIFLPYILGERAPIWNSHARGVFFGLTSRHRQAHMVRAVMEGIALALYSVADTIEHFQEDITCVYVSGGATHAPVWMQMLADIFNKDMCMMASEDASALGAVMLGMRAHHRTLPEEHAQPVRIFSPNTHHHEQYRRLFEQFKVLYAKVAALMT